MTNAVSIMTEIIGGKSRAEIDEKRYRATPGIPKICSSTSDPPISTGTCSPITVMTGIMAFRTPCLSTTACWVRPFARAVRM